MDCLRADLLLSFMVWWYGIIPPVFDAALLSADTTAVARSRQKRSSERVLIVDDSNLTRNIWSHKALQIFTVKKMLALSRGRAGNEKRGLCPCLDGKVILLPAL